MGFFDKVKQMVGVGAPSVTVVAERAPFHQGKSVRGVVIVTGQERATAIESITVSLRRSYTGKMSDGSSIARRDELATLTIDLRGRVVEPGASIETPFDLGVANPEETRAEGTLSLDASASTPGLDPRGSLEVHFVDGPSFPGHSTAGFLARFQSMVEELRGRHDIEVRMFDVQPPAPASMIAGYAETFCVAEHTLAFWGECDGLKISWRATQGEPTEGVITIYGLESIAKDWGELLGSAYAKPEDPFHRFHVVDAIQPEYLVGFAADEVSPMTMHLWSSGSPNTVSSLGLSLERYLELSLLTRGLRGWQTAASTAATGEREYTQEPSRFRRALATRFPEVRLDALWPNAVPADDEQRRLAYLSERATVVRALTDAEVRYVLSNPDAEEGYIQLTIDGAAGNLERAERALVGAKGRVWAGIAERMNMPGFGGQSIGPVMLSRG